MRGAGASRAEGILVGLATRRILAIVFAAAAVSARADHDPFQRGFDSVPIKPSTTMASGLSLDGARLLLPHSYQARVLLDFNAGILSLHLGGERLGDLIPARVDAHAVFAYQVHPRIEVSGSVPVALFQSNNFRLLEENGFPQPGVSAVGLSDLRAVVRGAVLDESTFPISLAGIVELRAPTGDGTSFLGDDGVVFAPRVAVERGLGPFRFLGNLGVKVRSHAQFLNLYVGSELVVGAGAIFQAPFSLPWARRIELLGELQLSTPFAAPFTFQYADSLKTPFELQVGARARLFQRWGVQLAVGRGLGLQTGYGREAFRFVVGATYSLDRAAEADRDGDSVPDAVDQCPGEAEDLDGFQDGDGCPDPDNDSDGVPDAQDQCPDQSGPPELDGCPDRDGDEIPDVVDRCPDEPGAPEREGCPYEDPQVVLESDRIRIRGNILFETASARIQSRSFGMLDQVYKVLAENPEVGPIQVEGHTDNRGGATYNRNLSEKRAQSVVDYLVKKGIDRKRLRAKGFGFDRPVATNATPLGRAKNRRVEFNLIQEEQDPSRTLQQIEDLTEKPDGGT